MGMGFSHSKLLSCHIYPVVCKIFTLFLLVLILKTLFLSPLPGLHWFQQKGVYWIPDYSPVLQNAVRRDRFLEAPQIIWGLNNQKIAFARACLTARLLNRTLLIPSLSASLIYKDIDLLKPIAFDKVFNFERFNSLCKGFVRLGQYSNLHNETKPFELRKGSGRKWTKDRDLNQLEQCKEDSIDKFEVIRIVGKHPFLWHDHWPIMDYARIFECLEFVDEIEADVTAVISRIKSAGAQARSKDDFDKNQSLSVSSLISVPYIAVHMRIEKDWMLHCKNLEQRSNIYQICSSKTEIMDRIANIRGLINPTVVYIAVADSLLEDNSILDGWKVGLLPFEKKKLGIWNIYIKHPYLIQSAIDYEVCLRADVFVGNSFSTFSSLIVLHRTRKLIKMGVANLCDGKLNFSSYAYNILGDFGGPKKWMTDLSASSLQHISYGTNNISCQSESVNKRDS